MLAWWNFEFICVYIVAREAFIALCLYSVPCTYLKQTSFDRRIDSRYLYFSGRGPLNPNGPVADSIS